MATETATSTKTSPLAQQQVVEYEHYIDQQIDKTRLHVKLVDLGAALLTLLIALLASLMVLVIVDHWIVGLGSLGTSRLARRDHRRQRFFPRRPRCTSRAAWYQSGVRGSIHRADVSGAKELANQRLTLSLPSC